jgi:hypothetical protein
MKTNVRNTIFFELKIIKEYWQITSILATIIFFCVYFWLQSKEANERVEELSITNKELKDRISRLEGQVDVINSNMVLFVERNPGLTTYRLEMLEEAMDVQQVLNSLNRRNETEIKIVQIPTPVPVFNPSLTPPTYNPTQIQRSDSKVSVPQKKKSLFKNN